MFIFLLLYFFILLLGGIIMDLFVQPRKKDNINAHNAYILGSDLTSLATACYLIRDGGMKGEHIHIIDSQKDLEHYESYLSYVDQRSFYLWDLLRSIPSLQQEGLSVLDEITYLNEDAPMHPSLNFSLKENLISELVHFFFISDEQLKNKSIEEIFSKEFLESDFYHYWHALFPIKDAYTFKITLHRYMHILTSDSIASSKYCFFDSVIKPIIEYLNEHHVIFHLDTEVTDILIENNIASSFTIKNEGIEETIGLTDKDLLFIHTHLCHTLKGSQEEPINKDVKMIHAIITTLDEKIIHYLKNIFRVDPLSGQDVTGGIIPINESAWELNWTIPRQPYYINQQDNQCIILIHGLNTHVIGDFIKKPMNTCTGWEICAEWLYHIGIPEEEILPLALTSASTIPYIQEIKERKTQTEGLNYTYIGEGVELVDEYPGSYDYLVHTAMNAVYRLLHISRNLPAYRYSIEDYLKVFASLYGDKTFVENRSLTTRLVLKELLKKIQGSDLEALLKEYKFY